MKYMNSNKDKLYHTEDAVKKRVDGIISNKAISDKNKQLLMGFLQTCQAKGLLQG